MSSGGPVGSHTIGEAADAAGVTTRAVRLYESKGLIRAAERNQSGYRLFTDDDVQVLAFIRRGRSLGLSLGAIAEIIEISEHGAPCERTNALLTQRLAEIDGAITDLQALRDTITDAQRVRTDQPGSRCAVIEQAADSS
jgi:DNA-binding transcriptional MerR regulator